jgi:polysaccharide chain length determinant protein (PEP-CTERM system associated)
MIGMRSFVILNTAALLWSAWRRRYLIAIPILVLPVLALFGGLLSSKKYVTHTTVLIQEAAKQNPFLQDLTVSTNLKSRMEALNALLHSRHILAGVAEEAGLLGEETSLSQREAVISNLSGSLRARLLGDDLVQITLTGQTPDGMRELLAAVSRQFVDRVVAPQKSAIGKSEAFLVKELEKRRLQLQTAEKKLSDYKTRFAEQLPNQHSSKVNRLTEVRDDLATRSISLDGAIAAREGLRLRLVRTNPILGRLEQAIYESGSQLAVLRARYSDKHSRVQGELRRLRSLESKRAKALESSRQLNVDDLERLWHRASSESSAEDARILPLIVSQFRKLQEADSLVRRLQQEIAALDAERKDLELRVSAYGEHERQLQGLEREIAVKRKIFNELADRHQKAQVTGALGRSEEDDRVKLIDPPFAPAGPTNMPVILYLISGLIGGIALGIGLAVAAELLDTTIWRRQALSELLAVPVLTRIPVLPSQGFCAETGGIDPTFFEEQKETH